MIFLYLYAKTTMNIVVPIALNVMLWMEYHLMAPDIDTDFGDIRDGKLRTYLLIAALVGYLCILAYTGLVVWADPPLPTPQVNLITWAIGFYYAFQLMFLPLVRETTSRRRIHKVWVRSLLVACIFPVAALTYAAVQVRNTLLIALSAIALLHTVLNDALLYGAYF